jgi:DNA-directed RNA polymerase
MINELKAMGIDRFNNPSSSSSTTPSTTTSTSSSSSSTTTTTSTSDMDTDTNSKKGATTTMGTGNSSGKFLELNQLIPPLPPRGNLNIQDVIKSKYFFA